jgi:4-hydroxy-2-oxoheptanedioate aldolase
MLNPLKARLRDGHPVLGVLVTMPSVPLIQVLARAGFDWLFIDMEHGPIDIASCHAMIAATAGAPAVPVVRVPWNVHWLAKPVLDAGAFGIVFPMVRSAEEAAASVRAMRYPPAGERGSGAFYAPPRWGVTGQQYAEAANDEVLTIVLIEHADAIDRIGEIVRVPGIDVAFIAPYDLAASLGHSGHPEHVDIRAAVASAEAAILRAGITLGGLALTTAEANAMIARGYRALALGFDVLLLQRGAASVLDGVVGR